MAELPSNNNHRDLCVTMSSRARNNVAIRVQLILYVPAAKPSQPSGGGNKTFIFRVSLLCDSIVVLSGFKTMDDEPRRSYASRQNKRREGEASEKSPARRRNPGEQVDDDRLR